MFVCMPKLILDVKIYMQQTTYPKNIFVAVSSCLKIIKKGAEFESWPLEQMAVYTAMIL